MATTQVTISPEALKASQHSERSPDPCIVVIFGASGDLTKRKLLPALYHLEQAGNLPSNFAVVGVARRPLEDSFAADMKEGIESGGGVEANDPKVDEFVGRIRYHAISP
jgi:glucose-6-phosphate 1-dehydrogenase